MATEEIHSNTFRRPHKKSRFGCKNCKQRRIKCDEGHPSCSNCIRRKVRCDFLPSDAQQPDRSSPVRLALPPTFSPPTTQPPRAASDGDEDEDRHVFHAYDLELMHHYSTMATSGLPADQEQDEALWRVDVPRIAFRNPPVMHLILSLSALHLRATETPSVRPGWLLLQAHGHVSKTSGLLAQAFRAGDRPRDCHLTALLLTMQTLTSGPMKHDYLTFHHTGKDKHWSNLRTSRRLYAAGVAAGEELLPPPPGDEHAPGGDGATADDKPPVTHGEFEYKLHFFRLMRFLESLAAEDAALDMYVVAYKQLGDAFAGLHSPRRRARVGRLRAFAGALTWLFRVSDAFVAALHQRRPLALVVFAYFALLLHLLDEPWLVAAWPSHLLEGIHLTLHPSYLEWTSWPREKVGWVAPLAGKEDGEGAAGAVADPFGGRLMEGCPLRLHNEICAPR